VWVTVVDGTARFHLYKYLQGDLFTLIKRDLDLFQHNDFLNLSDPSLYMNLDVGFSEWKPPYNRNDSNSNTGHMIMMTFRNTPVFYLCREFISSTMMYFILHRPRSKSSLCTLGYMFIHRHPDVGLPAALLREGENSLIPSVGQHSSHYSAAEASTSNPGPLAPNLRGKNIDTSMGSERRY
jgi:hypothetical protein